MIYTPCQNFSAHTGSGVLSISEALADSRGACVRAGSCPAAAFHTQRTAVHLPSRNPCGLMLGITSATHRLSTRPLLYNFAKINSARSNGLGSNPPALPSPSLGRSTARRRAARNVHSAEYQGVCRLHNIKVAGYSAISLCECCKERH